ncbi:hypothetical protein [Lacisediminihabitans profunda]|uniref:PE-PGRS family protein n=1 Tax=Lacisediminihabitans profunda TaxID=2594790 RepID=A0A5C8UN11_9MICO|nr:hypothetical protein [Lacisediminihabitans profunda]TXN29766.1 hypothetical protein FVP33_11490 [Lacisediminihabitans profunda]
MARRDIPLTTSQLEILAWIRDGIPDGSYHDYTPRIVARALHNRQLVVITGRGQSWTATITEDGVYYLEHGTYPPNPNELARAERVTPSESASPQPKKPPRVGPTDAMMAALAAAPDHRVDITYDETNRYRQLALTAERFKKIPAGMQVIVSSDYQTRAAWIALEPLPEWRTRVLEPVTVSTQLRDPTDVVTAMQNRNDLDIRAAEKKRALRIVQGFVLEARRRGYTVKPVPAPRKNSWGYAERSDETTGHLMVQIDPDCYRISVFQIKDKVEHVASKSELARSGRGYALPKWDYVPTERLGIRIETQGYSFWASSWSDKPDHFLEDLLPQILQELELRHDRAQDQRIEEERRRLERRTRWQQARDNAIAQLTEAHRSDVLFAEINNWQQAAKIRDYVAALTVQVASYDDPIRVADTQRWIDWALAHAKHLDPFNRSLQLPNAPEASAAALAPYMGSWSPYGP